MPEDDFEQVEEGGDDILRALRYLAARCDGARELDGAGFNKFDAETGKSLAAKEQLTPGEAIKAHRLLWKYKKQLKAGGIEYADIEPPSGEESEKPARLVTAHTSSDGRRFFVLNSPYDSDHVVALKMHFERRWWTNTTDVKGWLVPVSDRESVVAFAKLHGYKGTRAAVEMVPTAEEVDYYRDLVHLSRDGSGEPKCFTLKGPRVGQVGYDLRRVMENDVSFRYEPRGLSEERTVADVSFKVVEALSAWTSKNGFEWTDEAHTHALLLIEERKSLVDESKATDADIEIPGLALELMPFQRAGVKYAAKRDATLIADEMGLGKTFQALATVQYKDAYPCLVICPASLVNQWQREVFRLLPDKDVRKFNEEEIEGADIFIISYNSAASTKYMLEDYPWASVIVDEGHYIKNRKARRSKFLVGFKGRDAWHDGLLKSIPLKLILSGTPVVNRPQDLIQILRALDKLDHFGGPKAFLERYCQAARIEGTRKIVYDYETGGKHLDELSRKMRELCMVRRLKKDVLKELPEKTYSHVSIELRDPAEYVKYIKKITQEEVRHAGDALALMTKLRRYTAQQKLSNAIDWIRDFLDGTDKKLVVFSHHQEICDTIWKTFREEANLIRGGVTMDDRDDLMDQFQDKYCLNCGQRHLEEVDGARARERAYDHEFVPDKRIRLLVVSVTAGGHGLNLTAAHEVAFVELPWTPKDVDQAIDRVHRIGQKERVTAYYLLAANSFDEVMAEIIDSKRVVSEKIMDGVEHAADKLLMEMWEKFKDQVEGM